MAANYKTELEIETDGVCLLGDLCVPATARGLVVFAHGGGSSRKSPRNRYVAERLNDFRLATLLPDLLTEDEKPFDRVTRKLRFDMDLLQRRVVGLVKWAESSVLTDGLAIGCFGANTGAAGVLMAAAARSETIRAVVSRGGRPDLAVDALSRVKAPTLLIVGGHDGKVIEFNRLALAAMREKNEIRIVPRASHLFEEPGALDKVAELSGSWFARHLGAYSHNQKMQPKCWRNKAGDCASTVK